MSTAMTTPEHKGLESPAGYELKITRVFDAPRDLVWKASTDPAMQMQWMGPRGFITTELEMPEKTTMVLPWSTRPITYCSARIWPRTMNMANAMPAS